MSTSTACGFAYFHYRSIAVQMRVCARPACNHARHCRALCGCGAVARRVCVAQPKLAFKHSSPTAPAAGTGTRGRSSRSCPVDCESPCRRVVVCTSCKQARRTGCVRRCDDGKHLEIAHTHIRICTHTCDECGARDMSNGARVCKRKRNARTDKVPTLFA